MKLKLVGSFLCLLIPLIATGCGNSAKHMKRVTAEEGNIASDRTTFAIASLKCLKSERLGIGDPEPVEGLAHDVYEVIRIYRNKPTATYEGKPIRTALAESAESLEGCYREDARQIRNALIYG
jgi:hypothetical protein